MIRLQKSVCVLLFVSPISLLPRCVTVLLFVSSIGLLPRCVTDVRTSVSLVSPNGGEVFYVSDLCTIRVSGPDTRESGSDPFSFYVAVGSDRSFVEITDQLVRLSGLSPAGFVWLIPNSVSFQKDSVWLPSKDAAIRVCLDGACDESDNVFEIRGLPESSGNTTLRLMVPNGGEHYGVEDSVLVHVRVDPDKEPIAVAPVFGLNVDGSTNWYEYPGLNDFLTEKNTYFWIKLPDTVWFDVYDPELATTVTTAFPVISDRCRMRVRDYDRWDIFDTSDSLFSVGID